MLKLTFCLRRLPALSLADFQDYWLNRHGPLVRRLQPALGMARYGLNKQALRVLADELPGRPAAVCRELTKRYEEISRGSLEQLSLRFADPPRGEITLCGGSCPISSRPSRHS